MSTRKKQAARARSHTNRTGLSSLPSPRTPDRTATDGHQPPPDSASRPSKDARSRPWPGPGPAAPQEGRGADGPVGRGPRRGQQGAEERPAVPGQALLVVHGGHDAAVQELGGRAAVRPPPAPRRPPRQRQQQPSRHHARASQAAERRPPARLPPARGAGSEGAAARTPGSAAGVCAPPGAADRPAPFGTSSQRLAAGRRVRIGAAESWGLVPDICPWERRAGAAKWPSGAANPEASPSPPGEPRAARAPLLHTGEKSQPRSWGCGWS